MMYAIFRLLKAEARLLQELIIPVVTHLRTGHVRILQNLAAQETIKIHLEHSKRVES
jgi:hypothetical protein